MGVKKINPNGCSIKILKIKIKGDFGLAEDFRRELSAVWQLGRGLPGCIVLVRNELFDFFKQFKDRQRKSPLHLPLYGRESQITVAVRCSRLCVGEAVYLGIPMQADI